MGHGHSVGKYEEDKQRDGMTGMAGIGVYLDLACRSEMVRSIERHVEARKGGQGWIDIEMILSLVTVNLVGGECVEDVDRLESDEGFCQLLKKDEGHEVSPDQYCSWSNGQITATGIETEQGPSLLGW